MSKIVIQLIKLAGPWVSAGEGEYLIECDVDAFNGRGWMDHSKNIEDARRFDSLEDAFEYYRRGSTVQPTRDDGKPNRPLTAWTVEFVNVPE